jgi:hypothetical protein
MSYNDHEFTVENHYGSHVILGSYIIVCANPACQKPTVFVGFGTSSPHDSHGGTIVLGGHLPLNSPSGKLIFPFSRLIPSRGGKIYNSVPRHIWQDYDEACKIAEISPKAAATLARRCLQGMIRDYWNMKNGSLNHEIEEVSKKPDVAPAVSAALKSLKDLGNIGAHPERDINIIVDIEPNEAKLMIRVLEFLFSAWYETREAQNKMFLDIEALNDQKQTERKTTT